MSVAVRLSVRHCEKRSYRYKKYMTSELEAWFEISYVLKCNIVQMQYKQSELNSEPEVLCCEEHCCIAGSFTR